MEAATAFRQEPPGHARATFGFLTGTDLAFLKDKVLDLLAWSGARRNMFGCSPLRGKTSNT
jgi:hypothetical protein